MAGEQVELEGGRWSLDRRRGGGWRRGRPWRRGRLTAVRTALSDETGAATAEYAVITVAAVGIAGLLAVILRSDEVRGMLTELVHRALSMAG